MDTEQYLGDTPTDKPQLELLRFILPDQFGPQHVRQLQRLEEHAWDGTRAVDLAKRIAVWDLWLFEVGDDDEHAVVLLSVSGEPVDTLNIEGLAGNGIVARAEVIMDDLRRIAQYYGAARIATVTAREGWQQLGDLFGFEPVATIWQMEVADGRAAEEHDVDAEG